MFNSSSVALSAPVGKSIWYRASVSGTTKVTLKIEYSTDGENWNLGTVTTDEGGEFLQGATQFVWGLAASTNNFLIDDIAFEGITYDEGVAVRVLCRQKKARLAWITKSITTWPDAEFVQATCRRVSSSVAAT
ncbi:hypothetical protein [Paraprevotella clara]|uniref:hypothetical protein n=1 Tax=Paraprevotella clara TaxID=454154 RepID=UPI00300F7923